MIEEDALRFVGQVGKHGFNRDSLGDNHRHGDLPFSLGWRLDEKPFRR